MNDNGVEGVAKVDDVPAESEQLDQLSKADGLIDRDVDDLLDEGYVAPDRWSVAQGYGNTAAEMRQGETIDMRVAQEQPEEAPRIKGRWNPTGEEREVGVRRAGRLVVDGGGIVDHEDESIASEAGIAGGAASAEEAAVHVIDEAAIPDELDEEYDALEEDEDSDGEQ